jgi:hypothetical protein
MFHVHIEAPKDKLEAAFAAVHNKTGIGLTSYVREVTEHSCNFEVSIGDLYSQVPKEELRTAFALLNQSLKEI